MNFYNDMTALKMHMDNELRVQQEILTDLQALVPYFKNLNGKHYNKKLLEAAQALCNNCYLYAKVSYNDDCIVVWQLTVKNRPYKNTKDGWNYPDWDSCSFSVYETPGTNKHIEAEETLNCIQQAIADLEFQIEKMKSFDISETYKRQQALLEQIEEHNKDIPYAARQTLNIEPRRL